MKFKRKISSIFIKGVLTLLPIYLTLYFIFWLIKSIEASFLNLKPLMDPYYFPGMGILLAIILILLVGWSTRSYLARYFTKRINTYLTSIPIVGEIYGSIQIMTKYFTTPVKAGDNSVVMVHFKESNFKILGITTRTDFDKAPDGIVDNDKTISVYIPMSYGIGGFTVYIDRKMVTPVDLNQREALKWAFIGGLKS
ncbi:hypothetical protein Lade_1214 [Legionella adelaidensis]|uniref:Transmembrane protein n=1 Tax=Legionella adelaidensis TaxID=45056 RepID=A0A0W0R6B1_9GAMM|nr:DUF502 domain-containing protein [Legionella adelaidensis]KTC66556.1 hypothetical protein Lade_1214 [Legionella adelaidensis]